MNTFHRIDSALAAAVLALTLVACGDPVSSMSGTVHWSSGAPVSGATVSITCSSLDGGGITATTDAQGAFSAHKIGCIENGCDIDVTIAGEPALHFPSGDYCTNGDSCCRAVHAPLTIPESGSP